MNHKQTRLIGYHSIHGYGYHFCCKYLYRYSDIPTTSIAIAIANAAAAAYWSADAYAAAFSNPRRGEMVMWDTTIPHHNLAASAQNSRMRMCSYVDVAPGLAA